jgi:short-subunit dehydrogenase
MVAGPIERQTIARERLSEFSLIPFVRLPFTLPGATFSPHYAEERMKNLRGSNAIVTGASAGLGAEIARALAARGVNLALAARGAEALEKLAVELKPTGIKVIAVPADVNNANDRARLVAEAERAFGPTDILINNAGVEYVGRSVKLTEAEVIQTIDLNLTALILLTKLVLPGMLARKSGHIVNHASMAGKVPPLGNSVYAASKAGVVVWSRAMRDELAGTGVSFSVVCPTYVSQVGVFARKHLKPPMLTAEVSPQQVVNAFMTALEHDRDEVLVTKLPVRPLMALAVLSTGLERWILRISGIHRFFNKVADQMERERYGG